MTCTVRLDRSFALFSLLSVLFLPTVTKIAADPIPVDPNGLPLWEVRVFRDFPVRIELNDPAELQRLLRDVPIASFNREQIRPGGSAGAVLFEPRITAREADALRAAHWSFTLLPDRERSARQEMEMIWAKQARRGESEAAKRVGTATYHTHAQIGALLLQIETDFPAIAKRFVFGTSVEGRELWGIRISDQVDIEEAEPEVRMASTMHGNEPVGMEMLLYLADYLTSNYATDSTAANLVDRYEIDILPLLNPDGYAAGTRYNANGVDLNRNYPVPDGSIGGDGTWTEEVETAAFRSYGASRNFVISENGHGGALVVNYPWDFQYPLTVDHDAFVDLSIEYSKYNTPMYNGAFPQGITNGAQWYIVKGSLQDWSYDETNCMDVTIEYENNKWPAASQLPSIWNDNRESFLHWIAAARYGVNGVVTDAVTGDPLDAVVTVTDGGKAVRTDPDRGDYYKLLADGTYDLIFTASGYVSDTVGAVTVTWGASTVIDAALLPDTPTEVAVAPPGDPPLRLSNSPDPFNPNTTIRCSLRRRGKITLRIFDPAGRLVRSLAERLDSTPGEHLFPWDGTTDAGVAARSGVYFSVLDAAGGRATDRMLLIR